MKYLVYLIVGVVALLVGGGAIVFLTVNPNDYRDEIIQLVEKQTGRTLQIQGDFSLTFFPRLGIQTGVVALGNAPGFGSTPFAKVNKVSIKLMVAPLLHKKVVVDTVILDGLSLNLARNKAGLGNWEEMTASLPKETAPSTSVTAVPKSSTPKLADFAIQGVEITHSDLTWKDEQSGQAAALSDFHLETGVLSKTEPVNINLGFDFNLNPLAMSGNTTIKTMVKMEKPGKKYLVQLDTFTLNAKGKSLPNGEMAVNLGGQLGLDMAADTLTLANLKLQSLGLEITGQVHGKELTSKPGFAGELKLAEFNPKQLFDKLNFSPPVTADPNRLVKASMDLSFQGTTSNLVVNRLNIFLDDLKIQGTAGSQLKTGAVRFDVSVDALDLDRYLPPKQEAQKNIHSSTSDAPVSHIEGEASTDLAALRPLNLDGKLRVGSLKAANLTLRDMLLTLQAKDGIINLYPMQAKLYEGTFDGQVTLNVQGKAAKIAVKETLIKVQAAPLLKDLTGQERITGLARSFADLHMEGLNADQMKQTLNGKADFAFSEGAVVGINIPQMIRNAYNKLQGLPVQPDQTVEKTDFSELSGSVHIEDGIIRNQDLVMLSPLLRVSGQGEANLPKDQLEYLLTVGVVGTLEGQGGKSIDELKNVKIPIQFYGQLSDPKYRLDLKSLLEENIKEEAKEKLQKKLEDKLKDKGLSEKLDKIVPGGAGGLLQKLPF
ncbi:MAG: AsmA family protein [Magnetococcus sp. DMHC-6]